MPPSDPPAPPAAPAPRPPPAHYDTSPHQRNSDALAELQLPPRVPNRWSESIAPHRLCFWSSLGNRVRSEPMAPILRCLRARPMAAANVASSLLTSPLLRADLRVSAPPRQDHTLAISHSLSTTGSSVALNSALVSALLSPRILLSCTNFMPPSRAALP